LKVSFISFDLLVLSDDLSRLNFQSLGSFLLKLGNLCQILFIVKVLAQVI